MLNEIKSAIRSKYIPAPADLGEGRDPVLARAVELLGGTLDPLAAGKLFPTEWK